ncbi:hypothetical protein K3495_g7478 [Podosphaera aphanis]|nr:hypothetical protein K3495_g7478 [Podosphaera aphanis]
MTQNYSDYALCGRFDGQKVTASRWLSRLNMDFKKASLKTPEDFFEAIDILFEDKAANWLDTSPRWKRVVDDKENATEKDVNDFKKAICIYFKSNQEESDPNVQFDLRNLAQGPTEPLQQYYQRSLDLLCRSHCRNEPLASPGDECLNPLEVVFLSGVITSVDIIPGIYDPKLRSNVLLKSSNTYRSLHGAYEAVKDTQNSMNKFQEIETCLAEQRELEQFRQMYNQGKHISAASARFNQQHPVENGHNYYHSHALPSSQPYQKPMNFYDRANPHNQSHDSYSKGKVIAQNTESREPNYGSNQNSRQNNSKNHKSADTKPLPPKSFSKNPYVNGSQLWNKLMGPLCIQCAPYLRIGSKPISRKLFFSIDARMCMLQLDESQPQNSETLHHRTNTWRRNANPNVEELEFEEFGRTHIGSKSCIIGYDNQHMESRGVRSAYVNTEYELYLDGNSSDCETQTSCSNLLKLATCLNETENSKKHARVDIEDILNQDQPTSKSVKRAHRRGQKALHHLREIVGRSGKGPINYAKLAEEIQVNVLLLDLFQMSPELSRAFRNLATRIVPKRAAKMAEEKVDKVNSIVINQDPPNSGSNSLNHIVSYVNMEERAFCVPAVIRTKKNGKPVDVKLLCELGQ